MQNVERGGVEMFSSSRRKVLVVKLFQLLSFITARCICRKCDSCDSGFIHYSHEEQIGSAWINVYYCDSCDKKFV